MKAEKFYQLERQMLALQTRINNPLKPHNDTASILIQMTILASCIKFRPEDVEGTLIDSKIIKCN